MSTYQHQEQLNHLNEAIALYTSSKLNSTPMEANSFKDFLDDKFLLSQSIHQGLPFSLFTKIKALTPFTDEEWAAYLNISTKTLYRHKKEKDFVFKPIHSEKILELAEVALLGHQVFDSKKQFYSWLNTPAYGLKDKIPANLLRDSYGKELVINELHRIDHGIFV